ncbi:cytochrome b6-f complex iron-sulfur subunit [Daejeonella rubra]|uniref:Cytochrome b6-f complex iron-sulfur subunit n=1 Tax=Daejeonella rubra TaxID=990371 RepID=A0A1G9QPJ8_9SPHI|nr:Rieske (2Fe-2S) protein [Daejeonella rubra]SDM12507.1 cytochrome b6-f complex iron-sulfur subunit [Daejeonella rubra]
MDRKEFLAGLGISAASFTLLNCAGCAKSEEGPSSVLSGPVNVNFTLDLNASANASLLNNDGFLISNDVIVVRKSTGNFIAVQRSCTHENYSLTYQSSNSRICCSNHGATFSEGGTVSNGPASRSLSVYKTELTGTILRVYS